MGVGGKSITTSNTPCESVTSSYLFEPIFSYSTISSFLQAVRLLRLSSEMESRAASLRIEALQCLTICLAGTDTKGFWDLLVTYFGAESDKDEVWGFIDPKSRVARPLDLESTDGESEEEGDQEPDGAKASTSTADVKPIIPRSAKVVRTDVCPIDQAVRMYPASEKSCTSTGIPNNLIAERDSKTTGASGASMYTCVHPECDPPFIAKGGNAPLFTHIRRHHVGICLECLYCPHKLFYSSVGWKDHMRAKHQGVPWYRSDVQVPEEREAAHLLTQLQADPSSLSKSAKRHESAVSALMPTIPEQPPIKTEALDAEEEGEYVETVDDDEWEDDPLEEGGDYIPSSQQVTEDKDKDKDKDPDDIAFPPEDTTERPEPPPPAYGHVYAGLAPRAAALFPAHEHQIRHRVYHPDPESESAPPPKKPKGEQD